MINNKGQIIAYSVIALSLYLIFKKTKNIQITNNPVFAPYMFELNISFKNNKGKIEKLSTRTNAWSITEARNKFQRFLDSAFKYNTIESLQVKKVKPEIETERLNYNG
jgi:hypothetical protein